MKKLLGCAAILAAAVSQPAFAVEATVADGGANVRSGPGRSYPIIASLPAGATIELGRCTQSGRWCRVWAGRGRGWIAFSRVAIPYAGRPGEENYEIMEEGEIGPEGEIIEPRPEVDGDPGTGYVKILGIVVDKPGYCYALSHSGTSIIVPCP